MSEVITWRQLPDREGMRVCSWCGRRKPEAEFHPDSRGTFWCRFCVVSRQNSRGRSPHTHTDTDRAVSAKYGALLAATGVRRGDWIEITRGRHRGECHEVVALHPSEGQAQVASGGWFDVGWFRGGDTGAEVDLSGEAEELEEVALK